MDTQCDRSDGISRNKVATRMIWPEILKVVSAVNTLVLFFCPCCAIFLSVYAHRMCIGAYFWLQLCLCLAQTVWAINRAVLSFGRLALCTVLIAQLCLVLGI